MGRGQKKITIKHYLNTSLKKPSPYIRITYAMTQGEFKNLHPNNVTSPLIELIFRLLCDGDAAQTSKWYWRLSRTTSTCRCCGSKVDKIRTVKEIFEILNHRNLFKTEPTNK